MDPIYVLGISLHTFLRCKDQIPIVLRIGHNCEGINKVLIELCYS